MGDEIRRGRPPCDETPELICGERHVTQRLRERIFILKGRKYTV